MHTHLFSENKKTDIFLSYCMVVVVVVAIHKTHTSNKSKKSAYCLHYVKTQWKSYWKKYHPPLFCWRFSLLFSSIFYGVFLYKVDVFHFLFFRILYIQLQTPCWFTHTNNDTLEAIYRSACACARALHMLYNWGWGVGSRWCRISPRLGTISARLRGFEIGYRVWTTTFDLQGKWINPLKKGGPEWELVCR